MFKRITAIVLSLTIAMEAAREWNSRGLVYPAVSVPTKQDILDKYKAMLRGIKTQIAQEEAKNDTSLESLREQVALAKEQNNLLAVINAHL